MCHGAARGRGRGGGPSRGGGASGGVMRSYKRVSASEWHKLIRTLQKEDLLPGTYTA